MEKQFCSYGIALAVKELGFDEPCFGIWIHRGTKVDVIYVAKQDDAWMAEQNDGILAPLYQQIISYLKTNYKILVAEYWDGWGIAKEDDDFVIYKNIEIAILKAIEIIKENK